MASAVAVDTGLLEPGLGRAPVGRGGPAMPLSEDGRPQGPLPWMLASLFAAFHVVLLLVVSGLCFAFPWTESWGELWDPKIRAESCSGLSCRWLAQNGEWVYPIFTGPLFVLTFCSLLSLHLSDPGILHQGSNELGPMMAPVVWVNHRAFLLQWCPKCCFLRPLRTYHIPWCNICVEEFDHHRKWVNNCIRHSNFRVFMLLVQSLCLYSDAMLVTCLIFLVRTIHLPFTTDKIIVYQPGCGAPLGSGGQGGDNNGLGHGG
ncbi:palmitoyltransferase ZDHHC19-like [Equus przewalskii]|uniref:Palmitoyltransferase n=1 Tax=Equus przewalskii TaxID=9798 RepID=A0ABM4PZW6_EQUPR